MLAAFLHMFRVELAHQVTTDGVGLSKQGIFSVNRTPIGVDAGFLVLGLEDDFPYVPTELGSRELSPAEPYPLPRYKSPNPVYALS